MFDDVTFIYHHQILCWSKHLVKDFPVTLGGSIHHGRINATWADQCTMQGTIDYALWVWKACILYMLQVRLKRLQVVLCYPSLLWYFVVDPYCVASQLYIASYDVESAIQTTTKPSQLPCP